MLRLSAGLQEKKEIYVLCYQLCNMYVFIIDLLHSQMLHVVVVVVHDTIIIILAQ